MFVIPSDTRIQSRESIKSAAFLPLIVLSLEEEEALTLLPHCPS